MQGAFATLITILLPPSVLYRFASASRGSELIADRLPLSGITSFTGNLRVENGLDSSVSLGAIIHFNRRGSVWIQESYGKVVTVPWFTTSSIGCGWSW